MSGFSSDCNHERLAPAVPGFYRSAKNEKSGLLLPHGREMWAGSTLGYKCNQINQTSEKLTELPSELLASLDFSCRKLFPVAVNLAQDFWLPAVSG